MLTGLNYFKRLTAVFRDLPGHTALNGSIKLVVLDPDNRQSARPRQQSQQFMYLHRGHAHHSVCTLHEALTETREQTAGGLTVSTTHIDAIYRSTHGNICKHSLFDSKPGPLTDSHFYATLPINPD